MSRTSNKELQLIARQPESTLERALARELITRRKKDRDDARLIQALRSRIRREPTDKEIEILFDVQYACGF